MKKEYLPRNRKLKDISAELRNAPTDVEKHLWYDFLSGYPVQFNRQRIIGDYIVDFHCSKAALVIELDGSQHCEAEGIEKDLKRTEYLESLGLMVLRFSNLDVCMNFDGVCYTIHNAVQCRLKESPLLKGGGHGVAGGLTPKTTENTMKTIELYTDGACSGNPGPGGWGCILIYKGHKKELSGGDIMTTNNRMELMAVIQGLRALKEVCRVELYSDSKYVIDSLEKGWAVSWRAHGWRKADKKMAQNVDLWKELLEQMEKHDVHLHWVKGHADNPYNNRCDEMAVKEWQAVKQRLGMI